MKTHTFLLITFCIIIFSSCKKDKTIDYYALKEEKEQMLVGNWKMNKGIKTVKSDWNNDGIVTTNTSIYENDTLYKIFSYQIDYDTIMYKDELLLNADKTFIYEWQFETPSYNPDSQATYLVISKVYREGTWFVIGDSSTFDYENTFKLILDCRFGRWNIGTDTLIQHSSSIYHKRITRLSENEFITVEEYHGIGFNIHNYTYDKIFYEEFEYLKQ